MFKKKTKSATNARKRELPVEEGPDRPAERQQESEVFRASKKQFANPLRQATAGYRSKKARLEDDSEGEAEEMDALAGQDFRVKYSANRNVNPAAAGEEGKEMEIRTGEEAAQLAETLAAKDDGLYHGAKNYKSQLPTGSSKFGATAGPSNVRQITITDYQPDVCKDYKETGFCGYGDSCKFLHDRGDYLQGWQLDNIYLSQRPNASAPDPPSDPEEDVLPFACLICRQPFTDPVVTKCGHYFDSACAIARYAKTPKCYACGTPTGGLFNKADKIFKKRDKALEMKRQAELEENGGVEENGEGLEIEGLEEAPADEEEEERIPPKEVYPRPQEDSGSEREFYEDDDT